MDRRARPFAGVVAQILQAGGLRDPSTMLKMVRQASTSAGFEGVTSHQLRKTVATLTEEAYLSARAAADQPGHSKTSLTADFYMVPRSARPAPPCSKTYSRKSLPSRLGGKASSTPNRESSPIDTHPFSPLIEGGRTPAVQSGTAVCTTF